VREVNRRGLQLPDVPLQFEAFKIKFDLPNCHSGPVWLELNHNNEKKQQTHGKDVTKLGRPGDNSKTRYGDGAIEHPSSRFARDRS
jgi:hypothetical protein